MIFFNFTLAPFGVFRLGTSRGETFIIGARDIVFLLFQAMRCWFNQEYISKSISELHSINVHWISLLEITGNG